MKAIVLLPLGLLAAHVGYAQKTEFSGHLTSGFATFRGPSAESSSLIILPRQAGSGPYTNNAYGTRPGLSYGAALQVQHITPQHTVVGVQAGYEQLRSKVRIDNVFDRNFATIRTDGTTTLTNSCINVHPFIGHRFVAGKVDVDLTVGPEVGLLRSHEQGSATTAQGVRYSTDLNREHPTADLRGRANLTAYYHRAGLSLGYSTGLTNYRAGYVGGTNELYSQVFRLGLSYRLYGL
jgi:hypothetical protein